MSKLGFYVRGQLGQIETIARCRPVVCKVELEGLDPGWLREARAASPRTFWVGRQVGYRSPDGLLRLAEPFRGLIDALEGVNEPVVHTPDEMVRLAELEVERCQQLRAAGWQSVVGNFATGNPELYLWPHFREAVEAADFLGLHEYSPALPAHAEDWTWHQLRWARAKRALGDTWKPLIITECGVDDGRGGGWRRRADAQAYMDYLRAYDNTLIAAQPSSDVLGATVFCYGHLPGDGWGSFDISGEMANLLADYIASREKQYWCARGDERVDYNDAQLLSMLQAEFGGEQFDDIRTALPVTSLAPLRQLDEIQYIVIHHSGAGTTPSTWSKTIANYHVYDRGWGRIAYHFLVYGVGAGKVRYSASINEHGYGVHGHNADCIDICLVGDYDKTPPAEVMIELTRRLVLVLRRFLGRDVPVVRHCDLQADTSCPGSVSGTWFAQVVSGEDTDARIVALAEELARARRERDELIAKLAEIRRIVS